MSNNGCRENICTYGMKLIVFLCGVLGIIFSIVAAESCDFISFIDIDGNPPEMAEDPPFNTALAASVGIFRYMITDAVYTENIQAGNGPTCTETTTCTPDHPQLADCKSNDNSETLFQACCPKDILTGAGFTCLPFGVGGGGDSTTITTADAGCVSYEFMFFEQTGYPSIATAQFCALIAPLLAVAGLFANLVDFCICNFNGSNRLGSLFLIGACMLSAGTFVLVADPAFCFEDSELECTVGSGVYYSIGSTILYFVSSILLFCAPQADPFCYNFGFQTKKPKTEAAKPVIVRRRRSRSDDDNDDDKKVIKAPQSTPHTTTIVNIMLDDDTRIKKQNSSNMYDEDDEEMAEFTPTKSKLETPKKSEKKSAKKVKKKKKKSNDDDDDDEMAESTTKLKKKKEKKKKNGESDDDFDGLSSHTSGGDSKKKKKKKKEASETEDLVDAVV